jgi:hypothetical protein
MLVLPVLAYFLHRYSRRAFGEVTQLGSRDCRGVLDAVTRGYRDRKHLVHPQALFLDQSQLNARGDKYGDGQYKPRPAS